MAYPHFGKWSGSNLRHRRVWLAVLLVALAAAMFAGVMENVMASGPLVQTDASVYNWLQRLRTPATDVLMVTVTEFGDTLVVTLVTGALVAWMAIQRAWRSGVYLAVAVGGASLFNTGIKLLVQRPRPVPDLYAGWSAFSFPSGHATVNAALYGFLGFLLVRRLLPAGQVAVGVALLAFVAAVAFSRLYLGAHWMSDVEGSLVFALAWTGLLAASHAARQSPDLDPRALALVAGIALALAGGFNAWHRHVPDMQRYGARPILLPAS